MVVDPTLTPVTSTGVAGVVAAKGMKTLGCIVTFDTSPLVSVIVTPPTGAPVARVIGNGADWLGPTVTLVGNWIAPNLPTLTVAEPLV